MWGGRKAATGIAATIALAGVGGATLAAYGMPVERASEFCTRHPSHWKCASETTVSTITETTPTTTTPTPPTNTATVFADEFDGATLDLAKWDAVDVCENDDNEAFNCKNAANAFVQDGYLHLRASVGTMGRPTDGAEVNTFKGWGWPPNGGTLWAGTPPLRMEARIRYAPGAGMWAAFWPMGNVSNPWEMDVSEVRSTYPNAADCHFHVWASGVGVDVSGTAPTTFDTTADFHTYWANYTGTSVTFGVDDSTCLTATTANQPVLLRLTNRVGIPGTWGGEGGPPAQLPADMLVDYVRVTVL